MDIKQTRQSKHSERSDHPEFKWEKVVQVGPTPSYDWGASHCPNVCVSIFVCAHICTDESVSPALPPPAHVLMMMSRRFHGTSLECSSAVHQAKLQHRDRQMTGLKRCQGSSRLTSQTELVWSFHNSKDTSYETTAMGTRNPADPVRPPSSCSSRAAINSSKANAGL